MGRKAVGPVCCVMHVKERRTLIVKEKGLAPVFLDPRLDERPAAWICARYKSSVLIIIIIIIIKIIIKQKLPPKLIIYYCYEFMK